MLRLSFSSSPITQPQQILTAYVSPPSIMSGLILSKSYDSPHTDNDSAHQAGVSAVALDNVLRLELLRH